MPNKHHNSNHNVINIKIDNTKKTKKRKSKRTKRSHAITPNGAPFSMSSNLLAQLPPTPQLTNRPYYMETNTINPQLQDRPTNTSHDAFHPPPSPPALTNNLGDTPYHNRSSGPHMPSSSFTDQTSPPPTNTSLFKDPIQETLHKRIILRKLDFEIEHEKAMSDEAIAKRSKAVTQKFIGLADKLRTKHSTSITNRVDFENEQRLYNNRIANREKSKAAGKKTPAFLKAPKNPQQKKDLDI